MFGISTNRPLGVFLLVLALILVIAAHNVEGLKRWWGRRRWIGRSVTALAVLPVIASGWFIGARFNEVARPEDVEARRQLGELRSQVARLEGQVKTALDLQQKKPTVAIALGGSQKTFRQVAQGRPSPEWMPVAGAVDAELDWTKFPNADVTAEVSLWVVNLPNAGGGAGSVRVWNLTDGVVAVATRNWLAEETPTRLPLGIPVERTKKVYQLQVLATAFTRVTATGELIVRPR